MTIDEFMENIAPKMKQGWVAMDCDEVWYWYNKKPEILDGIWINQGEFYRDLDMFDIDPVDDCTQSLRKVGK